MKGILDFDFATATHWHMYERGNWFFYVWQKRDFLDILCNTIYEDNITWTIPSLNFSFVDKRLKIPNLLGSRVLLYVKLWLFKVRSF